MRETRNAGVTPPRSDLFNGLSGFLFGCLPVAALILGLTLRSVLAWLWIPAFAVLGGACVANAFRCRRIHCYVTGPTYLIAAVYVALAAFHLVPLIPGMAIDAALAVTVLAFAAEIPLGRYAHRT